MSNFHFFSKKEIKEFVSLREGEQKFGEGILLLQDFNELASSEVQFVIVGIPEDIGVQANLGLGGTHSAFLSFLKSLLNIQNNTSFHSSSFALAGYFKIPQSEQEDLESLRMKVAEIDDLVFPVVEQIIGYGKIPVVIGGGHNNVYPLLKGSSLGLKKKVNVVNLDAHSDFRAAEGRHSGNGFQYAYQNGYLKKYALLGLHEAYNSDRILSPLIENSDFRIQFWEDIFMREKISWPEAIENALAHVEKESFGAELDLDCIENVLSSAMTPVGITTSQAMQYLYRLGANTNSIYVHLPEGVSERKDGLKSALTGKLLCYLVQAFCKGVLERKQ